MTTLSPAYTVYSLDQLVEELPRTDHDIADNIEVPTVEIVPNAEYTLGFAARIPNPSYGLAEYTRFDNVCTALGLDHHTAIVRYRMFSIDFAESMRSKKVKLPTDVARHLGYNSKNPPRDAHLHDPYILAMMLLWAERKHRETIRGKEVAW